MNQIIPTTLFQRKVKKFLKKFPSLFAELTELQKQLMENPEMGTHIATYLNSKLFKVRLSSTSKGRGKSGGFRVITYVIKEKEPEGFAVNLITIFDKSEESNIKKAQLIALIKAIFG